ncbi:Hypothetical protein PHPALM_2461 [Phytophthora palmivora]|uniref:HTH La-type RNA-binding domain-containing protein n=1 Tax=Phytophthora palmivora TaxID=4796 RepID=A0A2P4YPW6_9STRA|nr:Hypothetical protein PHPALM_2461 [Phytophthora palmivora]
MERGGKSQRKRLQRQLEFYLSESNLRHDKFLQQAMDEQGFVPARVFLSFNKLKALKATERMILDEADKSSLNWVDHARSCIEPKVVPVAGQDHDEAVTKDGRVSLVSLPRFPRSKKFKGFGFVEFSERTAAVEAVARSSDTDLRGIRVMSKTRWLEMKEQLKQQLSGADEGVDSTGDKTDTNDPGADSVNGASGMRKQRRN